GPLVHLEGLFLQSPRPQPVDEHPVAVVGGRVVVDALDGDGHRGSPSVVPARRCSPPAPTYPTFSTFRKSAVRNTDSATAPVFANCVQIACIARRSFATSSHDFPSSRTESRQVSSSPSNSGRSHVWAERYGLSRAPQSSV